MNYEPAVHQVSCPVRWGDMDAQQHVNNSLYVDYLQEARVDFLLSGDNAHLLGGGVVVVAHSISYQRPIEFSAEPVLIEIWISEVSRARFSVGYRLHHHGNLVAEARTALCPYDFTADRVRRLSDSERLWFLAHHRVSPEPAELTAPALNGRGHRYSFPVRWSDLDFYGHVNNIRFFDYVQEARVAMTNSAAPTTKRRPNHDGAGDSDATLWLVARQDVSYRLQMRHRLEPYAACTAPVRVGDKSMVLACEIVDPMADDCVVATARTVLVAADANGRPTPLTPEVRAAISARELS